MKFWIKLKTTFISNKNFLFLLIIYLLSRCQIILYGVIPFGFDHGKDSLAVMDMLLNKSPKLIGPWTSITGLYFGPGWYYLLSPGFLISNFHPMSGVITIMLLGILQLWLINKYFGFMAALIFTSAPLWFMVTTSAWNPFPLTLITWLILITLKKLKEKNNFKREIFYWLSLGFLMSSGFHFSTAFAVLYPVLIFISLRIREIKLIFKNLLFSFFGFLIPFLPQFIFEIRHDFSEVKAVINYLTGKTVIEQGIKPSFFDVLIQSFGEVKQAIFPNLYLGKIEHYFWLLILLIVLYISFKWKKNIKKSELNKSLLELFSWFGVTVIWLSLTHYNFWYLFGLMPLAVVFFSKFLKEVNISYSRILFVLFLISNFISIYKYAFELREKFSLGREFLPVKKQAIDLIYEKAEGRPFVSYHYVPDIYDFSYQYLYFWHALNGKKLPVEFAYETNIPEYITQKPELMQYFSNSIQKAPAEKVFFIVEKPYVDYLLERWWNRQKYGEIIEEYKLSDEVSVFEATVN